MAWGPPFLVGCVICGVGCGLLGRYILELIWREAAMRRYRTRRLRHRHRHSQAVSS
jgi:uncharacterized protein (DUF2062 family)